MQPIPSQALRFGVRAVSGRRAATWKVWTEGKGKEDVYLACRAFGQIKASLHESGQWHISFDKKTFESGFADPSSTPPSRFPETWPRPNETAPGVTLAYRIVVPWYSPTVAVIDEPEDIVWVEPASDGHATEFSVVFTRDNVCATTGWPGQSGSNTDLVGSFPLTPNQTVWVVSRTRPHTDPPPMIGSPRYFLGANQDAFNSKHVRGVFFGDEAGVRVMYDVPVKVTPNSTEE